MEAAGLVLSVVALFGSCLQGYQLVSDIRGLGQDSAILLCRLQIEEKRLIIWGKTVGFVEETCRLPAQYLDTVLNVLTQINSITQDAAVMKKRYAASLGPARDNSNQEEPVDYIKSSAAFLDLKRRIDEKSRLPRQSLKTGVRWIFDRKDFEKLVVDLRELNNGLYALLEGSQKLSSLRDFNEICLLSSASDDIPRLATIRDASQTIYEGLTRTADQRMHFLTLEASAPDSYMRSAMRIPLRQLKLLESNTNSNRTIARLGDETVLVEWREYGENHQYNHTIVNLVEDRIAGLSVQLGRKPKPKGFQVMDCVGYCHDEPGARFGIVFSLPTLEIDEIPEIISLYDLVHVQRGKKVFPSLNDRFRLSRALANSLLQLHSTKWLHRNLSSSHILFIKAGKSTDWIQTPYICGFGYSRPDSINAASVPLLDKEVKVGYQHPDLAEDARTRYRRDFDAYSLGIILVEIGFWNSIDNYWRSTYDSRRNYRRILENQLTGDLAHRMGQRFEEAVKLLLTGKAYDNSKPEGEQLVGFLQTVVTQVDRGGLT